MDFRGCLKEELPAVTAGLQRVAAWIPERALSGWGGWVISQALDGGSARGHRGHC